MQPLITFRITDFFFIPTYSLYKSIHFLTNIDFISNNVISYSNNYYLSINNLYNQGILSKP